VSANTYSLKNTCIFAQHRVRKKTTTTHPENKQPLMN